ARGHPGVTRARSRARAREGATPGGLTPCHALLDTVSGLARLAMSWSSSASLNSPTGEAAPVRAGADFSIPRTSANVRAAATLALGLAVLSRQALVSVVRTNSLIPS